MVLVGRIARPHGLRGDVIVNPETDFVEDRFRPGEVLWTRTADRDEPLIIGTVRLQNGRPLIGFTGVSSIEDAERLAGLELRIPEETMRPLGAGQYYGHQLVGCAVETAQGEQVGCVARVEGGAGGSRLVLEGPRGEILIPLAVDICVDVDVAGRRIRIDPPEGLLELNDQGRARR